MDSGAARKGKIFTHVVSKESVPVVLHTGDCRISGNFYLKKDERFSDALNDSYQFISIVDAQISYDEALQPVTHTPFIAVNRDRIDWIYVVEEE